MFDWILNTTLSPSLKVCNPYTKVSRISTLLEPNYMGLIARKFVKYRAYRLCEHLFVMPEFGLNKNNKNKCISKFSKLNQGTSFEADKIPLKQNASFPTLKNFLTCYVSSAI